MEDKQKSLKIYRYKFGAEFSTIMANFAKIHQYDDRHIFKEAFDDWFSANTEFINVEATKLTNNGYTGNIRSKIYYSVRYYYKHKTNKKEAKNRRIYININRELLDAIDNHIRRTYQDTDTKPSKAFEEFLIVYNDLVENECDVLSCIHNLCKQEAADKIKKTYKNRYYIFKKRTNS